MKIGIFCSGSHPVPPSNYGGVQAVNYMTAEKFVELGHEVYLFAPVGSKTSGNLIIINSGWGEMSEHNNMTKYLAPYVNELDIIIDTTAFGRPSKKWRDMPYIYRLGGDTNKNYCKYPDRNIVFPSYSHAEFHNQGDCSCGIRRKDLGVDFKVIYKPVCFPGKIDDIPFADDKHDGYYLCLGLIQKHKGPHFAVEFAKKSGVRLRVVGPMKDQKYFDEKIKPFLNDRITYEKAVSFEQKWDIIRGAIALLFTTDCEEGGPNAPIESLLTGTPVIGFNRSTITEIIEDGKTGLLCEDVDEMCERIPELSNIKSIDCRTDVLDKFSVDKYIDDYLILMQDVIKGERWI